MFRFINTIKTTFEYLGGVSEDPSLPWLSWMQGPIWWGIWWGVLILLTFAFSGQASKFIYIDF
jgi:hypothetical protein